MTSRRPNSSSDNRREFLKDSLMLATMPAGLSSAAYIDAGSANPLGHGHGSSGPTAPLRLGLLGCGRRGLQLAQAALSSRVAQVKLVALADLFGDRLQQTFRTLNGRFRDQLSIEPSTRLVGEKSTELLARCEVDAVIVAAATGVRAEQIDVLANAGKYCYAELPLAIDHQALDRWSRLEGSQSTVRDKIFVGSTHRYQPGFQEMVVQLRHGLIGSLVFARAQASHPTYNQACSGSSRGHVENRWRQWQMDQSLAGHPFVQHMTVGLDWMTWLTQSAPCMVSAVDEQPGQIQAEYRYPCGLRLQCHLAMVETSSIPRGLNSLQIQGTSGWCDLLSGKIYDQQNRLIWSAHGSAHEPAPTIDAWLNSMGDRSAYNLTYRLDDDMIGVPESAMIGARWTMRAMNAR